MATQQPPRPWFRLATMMRPAAPAPGPAPAPAPTTRPAAPTTVLQPTPPLPPFRPPIALPQPSTQPPEPPRPLTPAVASPPLRPPQGTAPPSPVQAPAQLNLPIASPPSGSRSPVAASPAPRSPVAAFAAPRSPVAPAGVPTLAAYPASTTEPPPQAEPNKPESPIVSAPSIPATRQVVSSSNFPPSPKTNAFATPSPPLPTSPAPKTLISSPAPPLPPSPAHIPVPSIATVTAPPPPSPVKPISTLPSPKVVKQWDRKTPPDQSPVQKHLSTPPSPLTLPPPAQLKPSDSDYMEPIPAEAEQKTVLTQDTSNGKPKMMALNTSNNGRLQNNKHEEVKKDAKGVLSKKSSTNYSEEQFGMRIITLAGENKGAVMELSSPSPRKLSSKYNNNKGQKINGSRGTDDDARLKTKEEESAKNGMMKNQPMDAFVNSNVQGVNNSILYDCAYTHRDPGVHLSVSRNGNAARGTHLLGDAWLHHH